MTAGVIAQGDGRGRSNVLQRGNAGKVDLGQGGGLPDSDDRRAYQREGGAIQAVGELARYTRGSGKTPRTVEDGVDGAERDALSGYGGQGHLEVVGIRCGDTVVLEAGRAE